MDFHLVIVILLVGLAVLDLVVGVSNDAVNFLNSSIGSGVASIRTILIVASVGVLLGASMSNGMMEIARKGIFIPQLFTFHEIMILFFGVMITDVILLDFFNSFRLPTSTTVSIVFELLGAATALALIKILLNDGQISSIGDYINAGNAMVIVSGIFLSVAVAFVVGWFVQNVARTIFSFQYIKRMKLAGGMFAGFCFTALFYFILIKGLKGAFFIDKSVLVWIKSNTLTILISMFIGFSILSQLLIVFARKNIFSLIVLSGTFALALSFAGNDLVNFIGVPLAGIESYSQWSSSGVAANEFTMEGLSKPVTSQGYLLVIAGVIMVITLWLSSRSRAVGETEVNLARQNDGEERFTPNNLARVLVKAARVLGNGFNTILPKSWADKLNQQFEKLPESSNASFDLVRASINLTTASILISIATSFKLPLSTTYVSFMVAMGTSLADRAWDRDSAVYRVTGVVNVVGGWFMTAIIAFTSAFIVAISVYYFTWGVLVLLVGIALWLLVKNQLNHNKAQKEKEQAQDLFIASKEEFATNILKQYNLKVSAQISILDKAVNGLFKEDLLEIKSAYKELIKNKQEITAKRYEFINAVAKANLNSEQQLSGLYFLDQLSDLYFNLEQFLNAVNLHVKNQHKSLLPNQQQELLQSLNKFKSVVLLLNNSSGAVGFEVELIQQIENKKAFIKACNFLMTNHQQTKADNQLGIKNSVLVLSLLLSFKSLAAINLRLSKGVIKLTEAEELTFVV